MRRFIFTIGIVFSSFLLLQCREKCKGISPELSEEDKKWLSLLSLNDSLIFKNSSGTSKTYYVVEKSFGKILDKGGGKTLRLECRDYDTPFGIIRYSKAKNLVNPDSTFFIVEVSRSEPTKTSTTMVRIKYDNDAFHFIEFKKNLGQFQVHGKTYNDVYYYERDTTGWYRKDDPSLIQKLYYSRQAGLIRYDFTDNEVWERTN